MHKLLSVFFFSILLFSCGGSSEEDTSSNKNELIDTASTDTLSATDTIEITVDPNRIVIDVEKLLSKAKERFELPLTIDSAFIEKYSEGDDRKSNLSGKEAKYLRFDCVKNDITSMSTYDITTFIKLDSIRQNGGWDDYQSTLDLGMARYSIANVIGKIEISEITTLLLWYTDYATYEACPYGYGTCVFGTLFTKGAGLNTTILGEISGGGDPPSWGSTLVESDLTAEIIKTHKLSQWGEEDYETGEEIIEEEASSVELTITPYGIVSGEIKKK